MGGRPSPRPARGQCRPRAIRPLRASPGRLFLVIEYVNGGDLMFHMQRQRKLPEEHARWARDRECRPGGGLGAALTSPRPFLCFQSGTGGGGPDGKVALGE